jgi:DNA-directed RNA polymerase specialized sigma24 family protein
MIRANSREVVSPDAYATAADFEQIFTQDMNGLYLLSFLLTGDGDKAEVCFVAGIGEATQGNRVFKEWARSWARRTIIQSAIRLIAPRQQSPSATRNPVAARILDRLPLELQAEVSAILELSSFERFVFVMSTLERYSDQDCSILLSCTRKEVSEARGRALHQLGRLMKVRRNAVAAGLEDVVVREDPTTPIEFTIARYFGPLVGNRSFSQEAPLWS